MTGSTHNIEAAVCCHIGGIRGNNEDNFYLDGIWKPLEKKNENQLLSDTRAQPALFIVCDGMGGQQYGEMASLVAVSWMHQSRDVFLWGAEPDKEGCAVLSQLSRQLWQFCQKRKYRMCSTMVAAALREDSLYAYGLGDSRIYLLEEGRLQQLTQDHTVAAEAEFMGLTGGRTLSSSDPRSHQLTQYFGMDCGEYDPTPSCVYRKLQPGQRILLCSDGLSDFLSDAQLALNLACETPLESVQRLVHSALEQGGNDNITAMVLAI